MGQRNSPNRLPISAERLSELLLRLHAMSSKQPDVAAFLQACGRSVEAVSGALSICEVRTGRWRYIDFFPPTNGSAREYEQHYALRDPVKDAVARAAPRRFYLRDELLDPRARAAHRDYFEWYERLGFGDVCVARIPVNPEYNCHFGFIRALDQPGFTRLELDLLDLLLPHLEQVLNLHNRLDRLSIYADIAQEQLLQSGHGLVILNEDGHIASMNRVATRLVQEGNGCAVRDGRLRLDEPRADARLDELVRTCVAVSGTATIMAGGSLAIPRTKAASLAITVMPFRRQEGFQTVIAAGSRAVVTLFDPDRARLDTRAMLRDMYGLSQAEAEVCWRIGNGDTVQDIAEATNNTRETVRSQVKRVFAKTGTNRQPDLVRLVLLGPTAWTR
jgi:DNA-binding CsgD family transcriptional regulator/PAS domain-containing protein